MQFLNKYKDYIIWGFFILFLLFGLFIVPDFGISWDEPVQRNHGLVAWQHIIEMFNLNWEQIIEVNFDTYKDKYYGVVFSMTAYVLERILNLQSDYEIYLLRHYMVFILFWVATIFLYKTVLLRFGDWKIALLAVIIVIFTPRIFAHAFFNPKDIVLMSACMIAFYTMIKYVTEKSLKYAFIHGLACAFAINTRIVGIIVPAFTILIVSLETIESIYHQQINWGRFIKTISFYIIVTILVSILLWPNIWENPPEMFLEAFRTMAKFPWDGYNLLYGRYIKGTDPFWSYTIEWMFATVPLIYLILGALGILFVLYKSIFLFFKEFKFVSTKKHWVDIAAVGLFIGPLVIVAVKESVLYNGWRQMYFIYPPLVILMIISFKSIYNFIEKKASKIAARALYSLLAVQFLFIAIFMVKNHPNYQNFFSYAVKDRIFLNFDMDYWGLGFKNALIEISKRDSSNEIRIAANCHPGILNLKFLPKEYRSRFVVSKSWKKADYFITNYYYEMDRIRFKNNEFPYITKFFDHEFQGVPMISVYKINPEK